MCLSADPNLLSAEQADWLSTLFDVGGIIGEMHRVVSYFDSAFADPHSLH